MQVRPELPSLRRHLLIVLVAAAATIAVAVVAFAILNRTIHQRMEDARNELVEEQRIAYRLTRAVTAQVLAAAYATELGQEESLREFQQASETAFTSIRSYLGHALNPVERLQLEAVKEAQQRLGVSAAQTLILAAAGRAAGAAEAARETAAHGRSLRTELDAFIAMREQDLRALERSENAELLTLNAGAAALAGLLIIGALLLTRHLYRRIGEPLTALAEATSRVRAGDLSARVQPMEYREFETVAHSFNGMAVALLVARRALESRNDELQEALEAVKRVQSELVQAEKLSALGRMMAGLAHELNNPLASVLGYGELLSNALAQPGAQHDRIRDEFVRPLIEEATRARAIIRDFLQFSRKASPQLEPVALCPALEAATRMHAYGFDRAGLSIELDCQPGLLVHAQPQHLHQILLNLVSNALDAMKDRGAGALRIHAAAQAAEVHVVFEDDGPGFTDPDLALEPFFTTKPVGAGTGLGLSVVHEYMKEFGGSVRVANRTEGGARVTLVLRPPPAGAAPPAPPSETRTAHELRGVRVLVVEDEQHLRNVIARFLRQAQASVEVAQNVDEARLVLTERNFDVVLSDVKMPGGESGLDLFRWVSREHPHLSDAFLFVTGDTADPEVRDLAQERPIQFLAKPFMRHDLIGRVRALTIEDASSG